MFLSMLSKKEQEYFLELANLAMQVDGIVTESEREMIENFRQEMMLLDYKMQDIPLDKLKMNIDLSTKRNKKVFLFELVGMMYADSEVSEEEKSWLLDLAVAWGFRENELRKIIRWVMDFNDLLLEGYEYINKKERL